MRKTIFFPVCIVSIILFLIGFPLSGLAQSKDQMLVIDDAGIFSNRTGEVEAAAGKLVNAGADVRVRTISSYGAAGNLDKYVEQLEQQSPSWVDQNGNFKNNLIVLIISLQEQQTGLYYGAVWDELMSSNWLRIQTDIMVPYFRNGNYVDGSIKGLDEIRRLIETKGQSPTPAQTSSGSSNWWIIPVALILIAGLLIGLFIFSNQRKNRAKQSAARQKAMLAKQAAASGINELLETTQMLEIKVDVTSNKVVQDEASNLKNGLEKAKRLVNQSSQTYSELSHSAGDPENPKLGEVELDVIEGEYQKILNNIRQAKDEISGVEKQISVIQQNIDTFSVKAADVNTAIEAALKKQDELKNSGFKTGYPAELIAKGRITLEQAKALSAEKRYAEGLKTIGLAGDQIKQAVQSIDEMPVKKQEAEAAIPLLESRIEQVKKTINQGRDIFERIAQVYAEATWESVRGNGTEAENRVNWALEAYNNAHSFIDVEQQEWHKSIEQVQKGNNWLNEADSLIKSIADLEGKLIAEKRDAPNEISAAQDDVIKAWDYINKYDEDIRESLEDDLRSAEKKNDLAKEELKKDKPDYFMVCKLAREANESADKILIQARNEHESAERLRAKAVSSKRDAGARVSIAKKYIEDHHSVVQPEARNKLGDALETLRQAEASPDINTQISLAGRAESTAVQAYSLAQNDVKNTNLNIPNISMPPIFIPTGGSQSGNRPSWGSSQHSAPGPRPTIRPGGGGSSGWSSGGSGSGGGGGSSGWISRMPGMGGGGGSPRGGGSSGW
jgi:uncharacterized membrane protein YgcG